VKVRELQTICCERINVWRINVRPKATHLGETSVIEQNKNHIGGIIARVRWSWEPGL
jgi:hypothetical protein